MGVEAEASALGRSGDGARAAGEKSALEVRAAGEGCSHLPS